MGNSASSKRKEAHERIQKFASALEEDARQKREIQLKGKLRDLKFLTNFEIFDKNFEIFDETIFEMFDKIEISENSKSSIFEKICSK